MDLGRDNHSQEGNERDNTLQTRNFHLIYPVKDKRIHFHEPREQEHEEESLRKSKWVSTDDVNFILS